jgi:hypothetical protein
MMKTTIPPRLDPAERRRRTILHEMSGPVTTEAIFIAAAQICVAISQTTDPDEQTEVFKAAHDRMIAAWLNDSIYQELNQEGVEYCMTSKIAATRGQRRKEVTADDIDRIMIVAKKLGL